MTTAYERSDIIYNNENESFYFKRFGYGASGIWGQVKGKDYRITILVVEDLPEIFIKRDGEVICRETVKNVDDLKIFLEERLYKYFEA